MVIRLTRNGLARLRQQAGFPSAAAAARAIGCSRAHLLNAESGRSSISLRLVKAVAAAYGVSEQMVADELRESQRELLERKLAAMQTSP